VGDWQCSLDEATRGGGIRCVERRTPPGGLAEHRAGSGLLCGINVSGICALR